MSSWKEWSREQTKREWILDKTSEEITKTYGNLVISSIVIKTTWARYLNTEHVDECRLQIEIFLNRLWSRCIKKYWRAGIVVNLFWEVGGGVLHCHCVTGWPLFDCPRNGLGGMSEADRVNKFKEGCLKGLDCIKSVWLEDRYKIDQGYIRYCLKEFDQGGFSGVDRVRVWLGGEMPVDVFEYIERKRNQGVGVEG